MGDLVKKETNALATMDFSGDAGAGFENVDTESFTVPYLGIIATGQANAINNGVKGALPGKFLNNVTLEVFDELTVIPCAYRRHFVEWTPQRRPVNKFSAVDVECGDVPGLERLNPGHYKRGNNDVYDTREHYILFQNKSGEWEPAIMSLSKTAVKRSKQWITLMRSIRHNGTQTPMFASIWKVLSFQEKNDKGVWYVPTFERVGFVNDKKVYEMARAFHSAGQQGDVEAQGGSDDVPF